jgi:hypothetical protein
MIERHLRSSMMLLVAALLVSACAPGTSDPTPARTLRAFHTFVGPHLAPPPEFGAYAVVAFPQRADPDTRERYRMLCEAFVATRPSATGPAASGGAAEDRMVTVWPVANERRAAELRGRSDVSAACRVATREYDLPTGFSAIRQANTRGLDLANRGPFLLAWAPASEKGRPGARVVRADLSRVRTAREARQVFEAWRDDIETNPELWRGGWSTSALRRTVNDGIEIGGRPVLAFTGQ